MNKKPTKIEITTPARLLLSFQRDDVLKVVGQKLADDSRKAIRSGKSRDGKQLPEGDGSPLIDTGRLVSDIKYDKRAGTVQPSTWPRSDVSNRARNSFGLLKIRMYLDDDLDPLGSQDPKLPETLAAYAQKALDNQSATGKLTLKGVGKKKKKIA